MSGSVASDLHAKLPLRESLHCINCAHLWCVFTRDPFFFVRSAVKLLSGDGISIPGVICSGRHLIPAERDGCQESGPECQSLPAVVRWQLASQVHLRGQTANRNKGKTFGTFALRRITITPPCNSQPFEWPACWIAVLPALRSSFAVQSILISHWGWKHSLQRWSFPLLTVDYKALCIDCSKSDTSGSGCRGVKRVIPPSSLSFSSIVVNSLGPPNMWQMQFCMLHSPMMISAIIDFRIVGPTLRHQSQRKPFQSEFSYVRA